MLAQLSKDKLKVILVLAYYLFSQYSFIGGNHINKLLLLIPLIFLIDIKAVSLKTMLIVFLIPLLLGINLLTEEKSNTEGWIFFNIHLAAAAFSILVVNSSNIKNYLTKDSLIKIIFYFGAIIIIATFFEIILALTPGRIIFGSQNLTSLTLAITIPLIYISTINNKIKFIYILLVIFSITILIKSRGVSFIALLVVLYYLSNSYISVSKFIRFGLICLIFIIFTSLIIIFNQRFEDLLGNSLHLRLQAWERFIFTVLEINPLFGYGPSNIVINFNKYQFINPQVELITIVDTFYNPHSELIFMFASGGLIAVVTYLFIQIFIIYNFIVREFKGLNDKYIKALFIAYLVLIISAQYDINNTTYATLLTFYLISAILIKNFICDDVYSVGKKIIKILFIGLLSLSLAFQNYSLDITKKYEAFVYNQLFSKIYIDWELDRYAPHFKIVDTLKAYHYLNVSGQSFNDEIFEQLIRNARKYNRYLEPSLHLSVQYFSFKRSQAELLGIYSDIFYKLLVNKKLISINSSPEDYNVVISNQLSYKVSGNSHKLVLSQRIFEELMLSNASFGKYMIDDFSKLGFNVSSDNSDYVIYRDVINDFLIKLSNYSVPLKM